MEVDWSKRDDYIRERHGVEPSHATEAVEDANAAWFDPDPASKSGLTVRVIGYSTSRHQVLVVIVLPKDEPDSYWGVNSWPANAGDRRFYNEGEES